MKNIKDNFNNVGVENLLEKKKISKKWLDANEFLA